MFTYPHFGVQVRLFSPDHPCRLHPRHNAGGRGGNLGPPLESSWGTGLVSVPGPLLCLETCQSYYARRPGKPPLPPLLLGTRSGSSGGSRDTWAWETPAPRSDAGPRHFSVCVSAKLHFSLHVQFLSCFLLKFRGRPSRNEPKHYASPASSRLRRLYLTPSPLRLYSHRFSSLGGIDCLKPQPLQSKK